MLNKDYRQVEPCVAIVVLNWNGRADTLDCIDSLRALAYDRARIIVVDNGSTDGSADAIRAAHPEVELIETGRNLGYAGGNIVGIERALVEGADFVFILNNDTACAADAIDHLLDAATRFPHAGMFSPRILYMNEPDRVWFDGARWDSQKLVFAYPGKGETQASLSAEVHETDYACGAALFVRAGVIREVGGFDPRYFLVWEEVDWCYRAKERGWMSMVVPSARVWHRVGASFGTEASPLRTYFSSRNQLVWLFRHGTLPERLRGIVAAIWSAIPNWHVSGDRSIPWPNRFFWAARDWLRSVLGGGERLDYLAKRRALVDFVFGRLGPTPPLVAELNRRWTVRRGDVLPGA